MAMGEQIVDATLIEARRPRLTRLRRAPPLRRVYLGTMGPPSPPPPREVQLDTVMCTGEPTGAVLPPVGFSMVTSPGATQSLLTDTPPSVRPAAVMRPCASP